MKKIEESIFLRCDCGCNLLEINVDEELKSFNFSVWVNHPGIRPMAKRERIRWCDHVMKTGMPWADHTIVSLKNAQRLIKFLTKNLTSLKYGKTKKIRK